MEEITLIFEYFKLKKKFIYIVINRFLLLLFARIRNGSMHIKKNHKNNNIAQSYADQLESNRDFFLYIFCTV